MQICALLERFILKVINTVLLRDVKCRTVYARESKGDLEVLDR